MKSCENNASPSQIMQNGIRPQHRLWTATRSGKMHLDEAALVKVGAAADAFCHAACTALVKGKKVALLAKYAAGLSPHTHNLAVQLIAPAP